MAEKVYITRKQTALGYYLMPLENLTKNKVKADER
jgi:hypothetical protein